MAMNISELKELSESEFVPYVGDYYTKHPAFPGFTDLKIRCAIVTIKGKGFDGFVALPEDFEGIVDAIYTRPGHRFYVEHNTGPDSASNREGVGAVTFGEVNGIDHSRTTDLMFSILTRTAWNEGDGCRCTNENHSPACFGLRHGLTSAHEPCVFSSEKWPDGVRFEVGDLKFRQLLVIGTDSTGVERIITAKEVKDSVWAYWNHTNTDWHRKNAPDYEIEVGVGGTKTTPKEELLGDHDSRECGYNYRAGRFVPVKYEFDPNTNGSSLPFKTTDGDAFVLPGFNKQISLTPDGVLHVKMYTNSRTTGLYSHDLIAFVRCMIASLLPHEKHDAMVKLMYAVQLLKDQVGVETSNNFSESPMERATPPDQNLYPTKTEWDEIYQMMTESLPKIVPEVRLRKTMNMANKEEEENCYVAGTLKDVAKWINKGSFAGYRATLFLEIAREKEAYISSPLKQSNREVLSLADKVHCQPHLIEMFIEELKKGNYFRLENVSWDEPLRLALTHVPEEDFAPFKVKTSHGKVEPESR